MANSASPVESAKRWLLRSPGRSDRADRAGHDGRTRRVGRCDHAALTEPAIAMRARMFAVALGLLSVCAVTATAHHGPGAYDLTGEITVTGQVTRFEFVNPHVLIYVEVDGGQDQQATLWAGELTSPNRLARMGGEVAWHKDLLQPGDTLTLTGNPARNGAPAMFLNRVVAEDGRVLAASGR